MQVLDPDRPSLRPVEAIPDAANGRVILRDPTQLAEGLLVVGQAQLALLCLLDGSRTRPEIQAAYARASGRILFSHELEGLLEQLAEAGYLAGPRFEARYAALAAEYDALSCRPLCDRNGFAPAGTALPDYLDHALAEADAAIDTPRPDGPVAGLVVPHLDFARGLSCYGAGYAALRRSVEGGAPPRRVVILGTNHFGRSSSVVATRKDFQTPWGVFASDRDFLARLEGECGGTLVPYELDHLREHSIELHVVWLHHVLGEDVRIVPVLCPDPSGPRGTAAGDPEGVDLRDFALALGRLLREDPEPTVLVASADFSHVGSYFGDPLEIEPDLLEAVRRLDEAGLRYLDAGDPEALRAHMAETGNPSRWCSVGCIYALMAALGTGARPRRLRYHQSALPEAQNCVTCAAYSFER